ncbi:hypothetical protein ACIHCQ_44555 [Streptomyces sp. NPDC052236]|uniref:hypothetical protein n=1 Tax=Streptomyces sp. NPDC052236 TaxID=3365686 RepID=UPI0037CF4AEA
MTSSLRKAIGVLGAAVAAFPLSLAGAPSAQAGSAYGCNYPEVCIYSEPTVNSRIIGRFRDITPNWQRLNNPETGFSIVNTRNDDTVFVQRSNGIYTCIRPNGGISSIETITAIRIRASAIC